MNNDLTKKYYTIGRVSEILDIPAPTLRYWESRFPNLRPRRNDGGQRRYTPEDIEQIRMVNFMVKQQGLSIEAAVERVRTNPEGITRHYLAIERLREIRATLASMLDSLNRLR